MTTIADKTIARNRKARHDYEILERFEAGIVLTGSEIKSARSGQVNLKGAYGTIRDGEIWIEGMHIAPYESAGYANHDPTRTRKLLLKKREIRRLIGAVQQKGNSLVALDMHLSHGYAKLTIGLARGKKAHDKREDLKRRAADMEVARAVGRRR